MAARAAARKRMAARATVRKRGRRPPGDQRRSGHVFGRRLGDGWHACASYCGGGWSARRPPAPPGFVGPPPLRSACGARPTINCKYRVACGARPTVDLVATSLVGATVDLVASSLVGAGLLGVRRGRPWVECRPRSGSRRSNRDQANRDAGGDEHSTTANRWGRRQARV
jgi:hypothetical protein